MTKGFGLLGSKIRNIESQDVLFVIFSRKE